MKKLALLFAFLFGAAAYGQQFPNPPNVGLAANRPVICTAINPVQPNQNQWYFATDTLIMSICVSANTWANVSTGSGGGFGFASGAIVAGSTGNTPANGFTLANGSILGTSNANGYSLFFQYSDTNGGTGGGIVYDAVAENVDSAASGRVSRGAALIGAIGGTRVDGDGAIGGSLVGEDLSTGGAASGVFGVQVQVTTTTRTVLGAGVHVLPPTGTAGTTVAGIAVENQGTGNFAILTGTGKAQLGVLSSGGTQCVQANSVGLLSGTGGACGGVVGPNSAVSGDVATYDGATGAIIKDGNVSVPVASGSAVLTQTIANGTATLGTSAISSGTCATTVTVAGTGVATTDAIIADFSADPTATTGYAPTAAGILTIIKFPTSGNVNFIVCNNTAASITPGAVTLNWRVTR